MADTFCFSTVQHTLHLCVGLCLMLMQKM